jgi:hypothetical protein
MVFLMVRQEAGPLGRWPKMFKGELEKPRDLVGKLA